MGVCLKMGSSLIDVSSVRLEPKQTNPVSSFADAASPALRFLPTLEDLLVCEAVVLLQMCCFLAALVPASQPATTSVQVQQRSRLPLSEEVKQVQEERLFLQAQPVVVVVQITVGRQRWTLSQQHPFKRSSTLTLGSPWLSNVAGTFEPAESWQLLTCCHGSSEEACLLKDQEWTLLQSA